MVSVQQCELLLLVSFGHEYNRGKTDLGSIARGPAAERAPRQNWENASRPNYGLPGQQSGQACELCFKDVADV